MVFLQLVSLTIKWSDGLTKGRKDGGQRDEGMKYGEIEGWMEGRIHRLTGEKTGSEFISV